MKISETLCIAAATLATMVGALLLRTVCLFVAAVAILPVLFGVDLGLTFGAIVALLLANEIVAYVPDFSIRAVVAAVTGKFNGWYVLGSAVCVVAASLTTVAIVGAFAG